MKDLAYTDEELAEQKERMDKCCTMPGDYKAPKYPWGLELSLDTDTLAKLGVGAKDFSVGAVIPVKIMAMVSRISMNETADGDKNQSVGLIATQMDLAKSGPSLEERVADKIYKKEKQD